MTIWKMAAPAAAALALAACSTGGSSVGTTPAPAAPDEMTATAVLLTPTNAAAGTATAETMGDGIRITVDVRDLPPGTHGVHVHTTGSCVAPDFASAGGHWNPASKQHGTMNPMGPHAGDLPNLIVGTVGRGSVGITIHGATMQALLADDGSAIVVHAGPDDLKTDPSGNSGGRIACGVFQPA